MSSSDGINLQFASQDSAEGLCQRLRTLGARPFHQQVVQSPWSVVYDVEQLYQDVKGLIQDVVDGCSQQNVVRCLTVTAPPGYGKTHLLAWNRQRLEQSQRTVFVYVPPYDPDSGPFENHVLRAALDSLRLHSPWQKERLNERVRAFLVDSYDGYIAARRPLSQLQVGSFWTRLLRPRSLRIGGRVLEEQQDALQYAFRYRDLLEFAFHRFTDQHPADAADLRTDWDSFVALAQLICGNATQSWHAKQWLQNEPMPPEIWTPYHLRDRCQGTEKIGNGLFTLMHLVGLPFCLTFDQVESTFNAVLKRPEAWDQVTRLLYRLISAPRFNLLFFVQASGWQEFSSKIPPMLRDRMTEGHGAQRLRSLDDEAAKAVVRARMDAFVWRELAAKGSVPPANQALFPFTAEEVTQLRRAANSELRPFLRLLHDRYSQSISPPPPPTPVITAILPAQVPPHQPTIVRIHGKHFRPEVNVFLAGRPIAPVTYHPKQDSTEVIEFTTPVGLQGDIEVRVQAIDDPQRFATTTLQVVDPFPRPYAHHVDRSKMRARRTQMGLNQTKFGEYVGLNVGKISGFERSTWSPPDALIEKMVAVLGGTLADYRK